MRATVKLPKLGETVEAAVILQWYCAEGQAVEAGEPLVLVETDKVETDVSSPVSGTVTRHLVQPEEEIAVGAPMCEIDVQG